MEPKRWLELEYKGYVAARLMWCTETLDAKGKPKVARDYLGSMKPEALAHCFYEGRFLLGWQLGGQLHHARISDEDLLRLKTQIKVGTVAGTAGLEPARPAFGGQGSSS